MLIDYGPSFWNYTSEKSTVDLKFLRCNPWPESSPRFTRRWNANATTACTVSAQNTAKVWACRGRYKRENLKILRRVLDWFLHCMSICASMMPSISWHEAVSKCFPLWLLHYVVNVVVFDLLEFGWRFHVHFRVLMKNGSGMTLPVSQGTHSMANQDHHPIAGLVGDKHCSSKLWSYSGWIPMSAILPNLSDRASFRDGVEWWVKILSWDILEPFVHHACSLDGRLQVFYSWMTSLSLRQQVENFWKMKNKLMMWWIVQP